MSEIGRALRRPIRDRGDRRLITEPGCSGAALGQRVAWIAREDLFTVVLEHFLTDTADIAD